MSKSPEGMSIEPRGEVAITREAYYDLSESGLEMPPPEYSAQLAAYQLSQSSEEPVNAVVDWKEKANCKGPIKRWFHFPEQKESREQQKIREAIATTVCEFCVVKEPCLDYALQNREDGIWGGMTESERNEILGISRRSRINKR